MTGPAITLTDPSVIARLIVTASQLCGADPALVIQPGGLRGPAEALATSAARKAVLRWLDLRVSRASANRFALARGWTANESAAGVMVSAARKAVAPDHAAMRALDRVFGVSPDVRPSPSPAPAKPAAAPAPAPKAPARLSPPPGPRPEKVSALPSDAVRQARQRHRALIAKGVRDVRVQPQRLKQFGIEEALRRARSRARALRRQGLELAAIGVVLAQECGVIAGSAWLREAVGERS